MKCRGKVNVSVPRENIEFLRNVRYDLYPFEKFSKITQTCTDNINFNKNTGSFERAESAQRVEYLRGMDDERDTTIQHDPVFVRISSLNFHRTRRPVWGANIVNYATDRRAFNRVGAER